MTRLGPLVLPWSGALQGPCLWLHRFAGSWRPYVLHRFNVTALAADARSPCAPACCREAYVRSKLGGSQGAEVSRPAEPSRRRSGAARCVQRYALRHRQRLQASLPPGLLTLRLLSSLFQAAGAALHPRLPGSVRPLLPARGCGCGWGAWQGQRIVPAGLGWTGRLQQHLLRLVWQTLWLLD